MTLFIASVSAALLISAFCSVMEAVLLSLTPSQIDGISTRHPRIGGIWKRFKASVELPIAAILVLNTAAHTIGASVAGAEFDALYGDKYILVFSLIFTILMLQFTEILPKTLGVKYNRNVALWIARPLSLLVLMLRPVLVFIRWINRPLEGSRTGAEAGSTVEEITALAGLARLSKHISGHQERIIKGAIRLARLAARDVMIPAEHIRFLSTSMSVSDALVAAQIEAHTRCPVIEDDDVNRVIGYVNFKELVYEMRTKGDDASLRSILRPLHYCGPDDLATDLVRVFVEQRIHMAIVRDNQQTSLGLITLEDLVEELVGEIEDEFDRLPRQAYPLGEGAWLFGGGVPVSRVNALAGATLPDDQQSLSAWMTARLDRTPRSGDSVREGPTTLLVRRIRRGRIFEVLLKSP